MLESNEICAIIVTYHPDTLVKERLSAISKQVNKIIIVDNTANESTTEMLQVLCQNQLVELILNAGNLGIAKALNIGVTKARQYNYKWALLFDQDSKAENDLVANLCTIYSTHPDAKQIALIGANYKNILKDEKKSTLIASTLEWREVKRVITSGSLLSLDTYEKIGPFREDFFIDLVDIEYCMRARKYGYKIIKSSKLLMTHSIGFPSKHMLFGKTVWTTNHTAIRRYYYARNYVAIQREYGNYLFSWWVIKSLKKCIRVSSTILFFEEDKLAKLSAIAKGWWHGVTKRMGKYKP